MKCIECGITIPEMPEDASYEEMLCNQCYEVFEKELEDFEKYDDLADPNYEDHVRYRQYRSGR